jgi:nucleotide-binding universal stress UspA family protein|tara:strand:+ start:137 stop:988 length:852 start_codon:yes stop_codon:yes gene_type:complete
MFRNLLIADSGKGHVEEMIRMLRDIPGFASARLNLLHVVSDQSSSNLQDHWQEGAALLAGAVQRLGLNPGDVNTILRQGDTKQTVLKVADELDADLIVMGSRGLGRLQSILANSASQYVFQLSTRPMLLVRDDLYVRHVNRLLVSIDGTGVGDDALKLACELARDIPGCVLTGVHITHHDLSPTRSGSTPVDALLKEAAQRARSYGVDLQTLHMTGDVGRGLCDAAEKVNADLVVIASQDRRPLVARGLVDLDKLLGGSVSDFVRVHAPAPVLLVREPEQARS